MIHDDVSGVVLAGGRSSRMGTDKAMLVFRDKPLILHATDILKQVCSIVIISANTDLYRFTGCEAWPDELAIQAPMIGIYSCLKRSSTPWIMVLSCDMPLAEPQWLATLLTNRHPYDVIFPVHHDGCIEPLCAAYNKRIIPEFERYISDGNFSLRQLVVEAKHKMIEVDDASAARMFININTSQDFDLLNKS